MPFRHPCCNEESAPYGPLGRSSKTRPRHRYVSFSVLRLYDDIGGEVHPGIWPNDGPHRDGRPRVDKLFPGELDRGVVVEVLHPQVTRRVEGERVGAVQGPGGAARHG